MESRRLIIRVAQGSITNVKARAIVLGHRQGMVPEGAERAVDDALEGAISTFLDNRSIHGDRGDFFAVPALLTSLKAEMVIIIGLGPPDLFKKLAITEKDSSSFLYQIAFRLINGLLATNIIQFATVTIGAGAAGLPVHSAAKEYVVGICRALSALDHERKINEFTIVEVDDTKLQDIHKGLAEAREELQGKFLFDILNIKLPEAPRSGSVLPVQKTTHLVVRRKDRELTYSVFSERPVEPRKSVEIHDGTLNEYMERFMAYLNGGQGAEDLINTAQTCYELMVPAEIQKDVRHEAERQALILNLESSLTPIPWELCYDSEAKAFLGEFSLGRQITREESYNLLPRTNDKEAGIDVLILANLSGDLPQAEVEGQTLKDHLDQQQGSQATPLHVDLRTSKDFQNDQIMSQILNLIYQGRYEIVHYCGHAFYDPIDPYKSGWLIDRKRPDGIIRAYEFSKLPQPPVLVFSNACESASMGDGEQSPEQKFDYSLPGAFIRAGVDLYIGNLVKVSDQSARVFAEYFYDGLFRENLCIGKALSRARRKFIDNYGLADPTWANYVLYGSPSFRF